MHHLSYFGSQGDVKISSPLLVHCSKRTTESDEEDVKNKSKSSVFNRLQSSTSQGHTSVFDRVGNNKISKSSVFLRLKVGTIVINVVPYCISQKMVHINVRDRTG